jgi:hypothetical protein
MVLWVESWVSCTKALTQWDVLSEYARVVDNQPLSMDCLWRLHEWDHLAAVLQQNKGQVSRAVGQQRAGSSFGREFAGHMLPVQVLQLALFVFDCMLPDVDVWCVSLLAALLTRLSLPTSQHPTVTECWIAVCHSLTMPAVDVIQHCCKIDANGFDLLCVLWLLHLLLLPCARWSPM